MKNLLVVVILLFAVGILLFSRTVPSSAPAEMTEVEIAQVEAEVVQFAEAYQEMWNAEGEGGCEGARDFIHPTRWVRIYNGEPNRDVDEYVRRCKNTVANWASFEAVLIDTEVRVLSPDAAMVIATQSYTLRYRDGSPGRHYPVATDFYHLERTADGWRLTSWDSGNGPYEVVEED